MSKPYKIMIVDDHQVIMDGLSVLLPTVIDCDIVALASSGKEAIDKVKEIDIDVIIMDLVMPGLYDGVDATAAIKKSHPNIKILCLSMMNDASSINAMFTAGANGYIIKNASGEELKEAIESISTGDIYIHPMLVGFFIKGIKSGALQKNMILKELDLSIIQSIAKGLTTAEIAGIVFRSEETVRSRRKKLLKKFSVANSAELVAYSLRNKLID